jgi:WD40 repeat protein
LAYDTATQQVQLLSVNSNREVATLTHPGRFVQSIDLQFSGNGRRLISVRSESVRVWDLAGTRERLTFSGHGAGTDAVAFHPSEQVLASAGKDRRLILWDSKTGAELHTFSDIDSPLQSAAFSPDGRWIAAGGGRELILWDVQTRKRAAVPDHPLSNVYVVAFDPTGRYFAALGTGLAVWRIERSDDVLDLSDEPILTKQTEWSEHAQFLDQTTLAWVNNVISVHITQLETGREWPLKAKLFSGWHALAAIPGGKNLAFISDAGVPEVWDVVANERKFQLPVPQRVSAYHVALDPSGRWLAAQLDARRLAVWDLEARQIEFMFREERSPIISLAWNADARQLAVGLADGGLAIWNLDEVESALRSFPSAKPTH